MNPNRAHRPLRLGDSAGDRHGSYFRYRPSCPAGPSAVKARLLKSWQSQWLRVWTDRLAWTRPKIEQGADLITPPLVHAVVWPLANCPTPSGSLSPRCPQPC